MGVSADQHDHARDRPGAGLGDDRGKAPPRQRRIRGAAGRLILAALLALTCLQSPAFADTLRIATWHPALGRDGPGLLLRDILRGADPQIDAAVQTVIRAAPDVLLLTEIDYDQGLAALGALRDRIAAAGLAYPHIFALRPNSGMATGLDLDGDGRLGRYSDAQGFGRFAGSEGMAILSRLPVRADEVRDFSALLWRDLPGSLSRDPPAVARVQRLSSTGHWVVPLDAPDGAPVTLLAFAAGPPVFDGPADRNGRRNHDEVLFWRHFLDGALGPPPQDRFILLGNANLDPFDSDGRHAAIRALLGDPRLQDPRPASPGGRAAPGTGHRGDPALDTADWDEPVPGNLRVDYVLPSADWDVAGAGLLWPAGPADDPALIVSRHRLVWVDLRLRAPP